MRILHLLPTNRFSGAENVACQIINLFSGNTGYEMAYCSPEGPIRRAVEEKGIRFIGLNSFGPRQVRNAIAEYRPDIIHAHDMRASLMSVFINIEIPVIGHIHCNPEANSKLSYRSVLFYIACKRMKHIYWVSNSSFYSYYFHDLVRNKSTILSNVIDEEEVLSRTNESFVFGGYDVSYIGRLSDVKDPLRLMHVIRLVANQFPQLKVAIVGSGEMEDETKAECRRLGLDDNVEFLGYMTNPLGVLKSSKVLIMTSKREGTPMCVLEAQALGIPVVSTPIDGVKDLIVDGENGYLSDSDEELAERITSIITSEVIFKKMSSRSLEKSHIYNDLETYKQTLDFVYRQYSR